MSIAGALVGHLYIYLKDIYPAVTGKHYLNTPQFLYVWEGEGEGKAERHKRARCQLGRREERILRKQSANSFFLLSFSSCRVNWIQPGAGYNRQGGVQQPNIQQPNGGWGQGHRLGGR